MTTESFVKTRVLALAGFALSILIFSLIYLFTSPLNNANASPELSPMAKDYYSIDELNILSDEQFYNTGTASHYAEAFHMRKTANGETFNMNEYSAAHKYLPFGTILKVRNMQNNKTTFVRINDRGPYIHNRIIDLSLKSAKAISGIGLPRVEIVGIPAKSSITDSKSLANYYAGYSLLPEIDPVCLPDKAVIKIDSMQRFHDAVYHYKRYYKLDKSIFLFVRLDKMDEIDSDDTGYRYFLGRFNDRLEKTDDKQFIAQISD